MSALVPFSLMGRSDYWYAFTVLAQFHGVVVGSGKSQEDGDLLIKQIFSPGAGGF